MATIMAESLMEDNDTDFQPLHATHAENSPDMPNLSGGVNLNGRRIKLSELRTLKPYLPTEIVDSIEGMYEPRYMPAALGTGPNVLPAFAPTARSSRLFWEMALEIRQKIYQHYLPEKGAVFTVSPVRLPKKQSDNDESQALDDGRDRQITDAGPNLASASRNVRLAKRKLSKYLDADNDDKDSQDQDSQDKDTQAPKDHCRRNAYLRTDNVLTLLLINSQMCHEVATMLYEHYVFELDLSENGIRFLDLPVIDRLEEYGFSLNSGDSKFGPRVINAVGNLRSNWIFSFARIRKLQLNVWGGFYPGALLGSDGDQQWRAKDRCVEMRKNLQSLVQLLQKKSSEPHLNYLKVTLYDGHRGEKIEDNYLSFWRADNNLKKRSSLLADCETMLKDRSASLFSNESFILQPLEAMRGLKHAGPEFYRFAGDERLMRYCLPMTHMRTQMMLDAKCLYLPSPEFTRHVSQLEDALAGWKDLIGRQQAANDREMEHLRDAWVDATIEEWDSDDHEAMSEDEDED